MLADLKARYERDGYLSPVRIVDDAEAARHRRALEDAEARVGPLHYKFKVHTLLQSPMDLATHPAMLDVVESLLGPNILLYSATFIIKEPHTASHVSWHQDLTYWGLSSDSQVSAWLALSPATAQSGCMQMLPGSHRGGRYQHQLIADEGNVLLGGQTIPDVDESGAQLCELQPGEASFHHGWTLHASRPNHSDDRRIGLNIQYITPDVRQTQHDVDSAMLVRGVDEYRHFAQDLPPRGDFHPEAVARHGELEQRLKAIQNPLNQV